MTITTPSQADRHVGFAVEYRVRGMVYRASTPLRIEVRSPSPVNVVFSRESMGGGSAPDTEFFLTAWAWRKPQLAVLEFLRRIEAERKLPERPEFEFKVDVQGKVHGLHFSDQTGGPKEYANFVAPLSQDLYNTAARILSLARWRVDASGPHQPIIELCRAFFSWDGRTFHSMPLPGQTFAEFQRDLCLTEEQKAEIIGYYERDIHEPFAHRMFREAWAERLRSPRSALIAGIAALEIGVKEAVAELVPDASWLVTNMPSPDVIKILREGLRELPVRLRINGKVLAPPTDVVELLQKAVAVRNRLAHAGQGDVRREKVQDILAAIRDTLSLLDYYCGREWALCHISRATLEKLPGIDMGEIANRVAHEDRLQPPTARSVFQCSDLPARID